MFNKIKYYLLIIPCLMSFCPVIASAKTSNEFGNEAPEVYIAKLINVLFPLLRGVGIILLVWAIGKFVISLQSEQSESKVPIITEIIIALCLVFSRSLLSGVLRAAGYTGTI